MGELYVEKDDLHFSFSDAFSREFIYDDGTDWK